MIISFFYLVHFYVQFFIHKHVLSVYFEANYICTYAKNDGKRTCVSGCAANTYIVKSIAWLNINFKYIPT